MRTLADAILSAERLRASLELRAEVHDEAYYMVDLVDEVYRLQEAYDAEAFRHDSLKAKFLEMESKEAWKFCDGGYR